MGILVNYSIATAYYIVKPEQPETVTEKTGKLYIYVALHTLIFICHKNMTI